MIFSLSDFGAKGDGKNLETISFRQAMNAIEKAGGGTLTVPPGLWKTGTVQLVSNLTLVIERGAVILGSENPADYTPNQAALCRKEAFYLFEGTGKENIEITGGGTIHGNGPEFWFKEFLRDWAAEGRTGLPYLCTRCPKPKRPHGLIYFFGSENIHIHHLKIVDSPRFTVWLAECENAVIDGLTIRNDRQGPNTDGLDIDSSCNVRISNCDISAGDDCIALKSDHRPGTDHVCENINVTNCTLSSATCGIRIGYEGDNPIRNCVFSNLTIHDTRIGLDLLSVVPDVPAAAGMKIERGARIEQIVFDSIVMQNVLQPFYIWAGNESPEGDYDACIRDILFADIRADSTADSFIGANVENAISDIAFSSVFLRLRNAYPELPPDGDFFPSLWSGARNSGAMLRAVNVKRLSLENFRTESERPGEKSLALVHSTRARTRT